MQTDLFMEFASPPFARGGVGRAFADGLALSRAADAPIGLLTIAPGDFAAAVADALG